MGVLAETLASGWSALTAAYEESPVHIVLEGALVVVILYIVLFKRSYDPKRKGYGGREAAGLTDREKDELIAEWEPEPLVSKTGPAAVVASAALSPAQFVITEYLPGGKNVRVKVEDASASGGAGGVKTSFCSQDYLALGASAATYDAARKTLEEYSLGSCGPRGFYGTTLKHLEMESCIASFMGTTESITYSDAIATVASAIPAFAKRGDVLLLDSGCSLGVLTGARLSRSRVIFFKHNDMADLRRQLEAVRKADRTKTDNSLQQRRFVVVEGLYANYGDVCPLAAVVGLAREFKWRTIVDDSCGVGVLGATGLGIVEHAGLKTSDVDILLGSLSTSLGSVGGFCVGSREVVDHQRLSGAGYCFSASAPPFLCATATASLRQMLADGGAAGRKMLADLRARSRRVHDLLAGDKALAAVLRVVSDPDSPIKHLQLVAPAPAGAAPDGGAGAAGADSGLLDRAPSVALLPAAAGASVALESTPSSQVEALLKARVAEQAALAAIVDRVARAGFLITYSHYLPTELLAPRPTLKFHVTLAQADADLPVLVKAISAAAAATGGAVPAAAGAGSAVGGAAASADAAVDAPAPASSSSSSTGGARKRNKA